MLFHYKIMPFHSIFFIYSVFIIFAKITHKAMKKIILLISIVLLYGIQINAQNSDLFFVFLNNNPDKEMLSKSDAESLQAAHLKNLAKMADEGKLIAAGPFEGGGGMLIIKAENQFKAWDYLNTDPAIKAKRFKVEVLPFMTWNGKICKSKDPENMVTYQFVRLISDQYFKGDENKMIHDNRIFMANMFNNNTGEVLVYGFFSAYNDGMVIFNTTPEKADYLISQHPAIKAGQLSFDLKPLNIAKGTFCE